MRNRIALHNKLPCAAAFKIVEKEQIEAAQIGKYADRKGIRLSKCQLGLFGYEPQKKIVTPEEPESEEIKQALLDKQADSVVSCAALWEVASRFNLSKLKTGKYCEYLKIKIRPCQLGAF